MRIALICSTVDPASQSIRQHLINSGIKDNQSDAPVFLHTINTPMITAEYIDESLDADCLVFCSKHQSQSGIPSFSVHPIGNFSKAQYGGEDATIIPTQATLMYHAYHKLRHHAQSTGYEVVYEATHHGPAVRKPALFIEIGSTQEQWSIPRNGQIIAQALLEAIGMMTQQVRVPPSIIGIGGLHTCTNLSKLVDTHQALLGHVCPVYMLEHLTPQLVNQMIQATQPTPECIVLDWKGLKSYKQQVMDCVGDQGIPIKRIKQYAQDFLR